MLCSCLPSPSTSRNPKSTGEHGILWENTGHLRSQCPLIEDKQSSLVTKSSTPHPLSCPTGNPSEKAAPALSPGVLCTYLSPSLIVVTVHGRAGIRPVLPGIGKLPRDHSSKFNVLTTATPLPALAWGALQAAAAPTDGS